MIIHDQKISVIIPAYNAENSLRDCLDSVFLQVHKPFEVLVINDGSTDRTGEIAKNYGDKITYIEQQNKGQAAARNAGIRRATGEYISFLDADDYWEPRFLERCLDFMQNHSEAVAVLTGWVKILLDGSKLIVPPIMTSAPDMPSAPLVLDNFFQFWAEQDHVQTGAILIRHEAILKAGLQRSDLRISQDLEYWAYLATFGKWGFIPEALLFNNSRINARTNWIEKYKTRRRLCPTVEAWQERVMSRLNQNERVYFEIIRGRVAAGYAHSRILSGQSSEALDIVKKYGDTMPDNPLTRLMQLGARMGNPVWSCLCQTLRLKEMMKAWKLRTISRGTHS